jgi:hypothetical protein
MGVIYAVAPIDIIADWMAQQDLPVPLGARTIQMPTPALVMGALNTLERLEFKPVNFERDDGIELELTRYEGAEWTSLNLQDVTADDEPCAITFNRGHESLIEAILAQLAITCGPLVLYPDYSTNIRVITADGPYAPGS